MRQQGRKHCHACIAEHCRCVWFVDLLSPVLTVTPSFSKMHDMTACSHALSNMVAPCTMAFHTAPAVNTWTCNKATAKEGGLKATIPGDHSLRFELLEGGPCKWNTAPHLLRGLPYVLVAWSAGSRAAMSDVNTPDATQHNANAG